MIMIYQPNDEENFCLTKKPILSNFGLEFVLSCGDGFEFAYGGF